MRWAFSIYLAIVLDHVTFSGSQNEMRAHGLPGTPLYIRSKLSRWVIA
jgi:hypothetical protein